MKKEKKALLIALVLGDGCITLDKRGGRNARLELHHCVQQKEYLEFKTNLLHSLLGGKEIIVRTGTQVNRDGKTYRYVKAGKSHRYFNILRRWMYPNKYDQRILKYLTPQAIAIWFMDDGTHLRQSVYPDGTCAASENRLLLCTTRENAEAVCKYFLDTWGIKWKVYKHKGYHSIRCGHKEGRKFHDLIHPYVIPSMSYKQRFYYNTSARPQETG